MTDNSIQYLKSLLKKEISKNTPWDTIFLQKLLSSESVVEIPGSPESYLVSFASSRVRKRQASAKKVGKRPVGTKDLIKSLSCLNPDSKIDFYNLENSEYRGTCFVQNEEIIGYEFVNKTGSTSIPGLKPLS
ncbi:MAG: hypothetical protein LAT65_12195 [Saccharospirillum sp.]|nr:hypothetical protein [Saccharospirillum sp.]